jgi:hypothetical protein
MGVAAAGASSMASLALTAMGTISAGQGADAADQMKADQAERAADFGKLQATLTDTTMRENLNTTLGNIEAIRAAGNIDPTSPTTAAVLDRQTQISNRQRTAADVSINSQVEADEASASYLRQAGSFAVTQSYLQAAAGVAGGVAKGASSGVFGFGG